VELAAAAIIILGSRYGLPLSTTHCMVRWALFSACEAAAVHTQGLLVQRCTVKQLATRLNISRQA